MAAPYWFSEDKVQARLQLAAVFALTLGTTGISVGFNFLGRDFYNALASQFLNFYHTVILWVSIRFVLITNQVRILVCPCVFRQGPRTVHQAVALLPWRICRRNPGENTHIVLGIPLS